MYQLRPLSKANQKVFNYYLRLGKVRDFVQENYSQRIPLAEAARIAGMETTYFSTYFRKKVGIRFSEWLRQIRITKAIELLRLNDHTITNVANEVGFNDLRTFERAFRKYTDMTPIRYKQLVRPGNEEQ